jgi:hypothetical protein
MQAAGVNVQCIYYQGAHHIFKHEDSDKLRQNTLEFYRLYLSP